ncbi:MAG: hypothetical protein EBT08_17425 [Betaproteobacteria bacterium]|nr:hypothetical protein [Betaproteobacteria bacterium]
MRDPRIARGRLPQRAKWSGFSRWAEMMAPLVVGLSLGLVPLPPPDGGGQWPGVRSKGGQPPLADAESDQVGSHAALNAVLSMPAPVIVAGTAEALKPGPIQAEGRTLPAAPTGEVARPSLERNAVGPNASASVSAAASASVVGSGSAGRQSPELSKEQHHVVDFITRTYQIAADQAGPIVVNVYRAARDAKLDPHLVLAVMSIESRFDPKAKSPRGAQGLMQVVTRVHARRFEPFGGIAAAFDPIANIRVGTQILKEYILNAGSAEAGLKGYVGASGSGDDRGYGSKVLAERAKFAAVAAGRAAPPTIQNSTVPLAARGGKPIVSPMPNDAKQPAAEGWPPGPESKPGALPHQLSLDSPPTGDRPRAGS